MVKQSVLGYLASAAVFFASSAHAIDIDAGDYVPAPDGTNLALAYYQFATRDEFQLEGEAAVEAGTRLDSHVGIARFIHYTDVAGYRFAPQILIPGGKYANSRIAGADLNEPSGFADPILANIIWLVNQPDRQRYLGVTPFLWIPIGSYKEGKALNLGENRWKGALQIGYVEALGAGFTLDLIADATWYGDNDDAGNGDQKLSQDESWQFQGWLRYALTPASHLALGYSKITGGEQSLDGVLTGQKTDQDQLRLTYANFVTPTLQLLGTAATDIQSEGGFREKLRLTARILAIF